MEMTDEDYQCLSGYIKKKFGIHMGPEKKRLVEGRLQKILQELQFSDMKTYCNYLLEEKTGKADVALVNAITTNHTFFMRETEHFSCFSKVVLPQMEQSIRDYDLRTWCAACSSGEEAYTLAMLIRDFFSLKSGPWNTKLLATDISLTALAAAKSGVYSAEAVALLPERWRKIYFKKIDGAYYQVKPELKEEIIYRQFNLINAQFPFKKKFHTIFCRNVMIYFDSSTRRALVKKFHACLEKGGYLFIGHSEVIDRSDSLFSYVGPSVYRKE